MRSLEATVRRVAAAFDCDVRCVTIEFTVDANPAHPEENGPWWSIKVSTPPKDRRFRANDETSSLERTLGKAEKAILLRLPNHERWSQPVSRTQKESA
jgi:hypothetical protein